MTQEDRDEGLPPNAGEQDSSDAAAARVCRLGGLERYSHLAQAYTRRALPRRANWEFNFRPDGGPWREHAGSNRAILADRLAIGVENMIWLDPDGQGPARWVSEADRGKGASDWADRITGASGLATDSLDLYLCTLFSDDAVILLYDPRWYAAGLTIVSATRPSGEGIKNVTRLMAERAGSRPQDLIGLISPSIGPCCRRLSAASAREGVSATNLWDFARTAMTHAGLLKEHIINSRTCTGCWDTKFFSKAIEGSAAGAGAILVGIRGDSELEALRAAQRANRAQQGTETAGAPQAPTGTPSLTEEARRLNQSMRCPHGFNKVYIRSSLEINAAETSKAVVALRCDIMAHVGHATSGHNIVMIDHIEQFCCGDYKMCRTYQAFLARQNR